MFHVRPSLWILLVIAVSLNLFFYFKGTHPLFQEVKVQLPHSHALLVLDMNNDKNISTTSLGESKTSFDLTNDHFREHTGWIKNTEAILVLDKNKNGKIDGINDALNDGNVSGFTYLKTLVDTNHDDILDAKNPLFKELQLWIDDNQNGKTEKDELHTLESMGITSIDLDYSQTNRKENEHLIAKTSHFKKQGTKGLIAEIYLHYDPRTTSLDLTQIENFSINPKTLRLPNIRGYGFIADSFIFYQLNPNLARVAEKFIGNPTLIYREFDLFINEWSGYTTFKESIQKKYNLQADIHMNELDRKIWIMEKFVGSRVLSDRIEQHYENLAKNISTNETTTLSSINGTDNIVLRENYVNEKYNLMKHRTQSIFALHSVYRPILVGVAYKISTDRITVANETSLYESVLKYCNDLNTPISLKRYLAKTIWILNTTQNLNFDVSKLLDALTNQDEKRVLEKALTTGDISDEEDLGQKP